MTTKITQDMLSLVSPAAGDTSVKAATMANFAQGANGASRPLIASSQLSTYIDAAVFVLPPDGTDFDVDISNWVPAASTHLLMEVSQDGGTTWKATTYSWCSIQHSSVNGTSQHFNNMDSCIHLISDMQSYLYGSVGHLNISRPTTGADTFFTRFGFNYFEDRGGGNSYNVGGGNTYNVGGGRYYADTGVINALRFRAASGQMRGNFALYRRRVA